MADSIETTAYAHIAPIFGALQGAADQNHYLTLDQFDRVAGKYGLMDLETTNGEKALQRARAKNAVNSALDAVGIAERLLSVSGSDRLAAKRPEPRAIMIAKPSQSFALELEQRRQRLRTAFGRMETVLTELRDVAVALDVDGDNALLTHEMGKTIGVFQGTRAYIEFQLVHMMDENTVKALHDDWKSNT